LSKTKEGGFMRRVKDLEEGVYKGVFLLIKSSEELILRNVKVVSNSQQKYLLAPNGRANRNISFGGGTILYSSEK
jgi:hypothetical protein